MNTRRKKLKTSALVGLLTVALLIILTSSIALGALYMHTEIDYYQNEVTVAYAEALAKCIDGDAVEKYIQGENPDEYYWRIQRMMENYLNSTELLYYYVYVPRDDTLMYVWDAGYPDGAAFLFDDAYSVGGKEFSQIAFAGAKGATSRTMTDKQYGMISCSVYPIYNSQNQIVALAAADMSVEFIFTEMFQYILTIVLGISFITGICMVVLYSIINKQVLSPIDTLNTAAKELVEKLSTGEDYHLDIHTGNEIEELAVSFEEMNIEVRDYIKKYAAITAEKGRIDAELGVAKKIQADVLPSIFPVFCNRKEFDLYASMTPAKEVGGDFYDFFIIDEDHLGLVMADVSGKGVPAAMFMMISKTMIKNCAQNTISPSEILSIVNNALCENNEEDMFVTVWLGILEISTGKMTCSNAGHEYPILCKADGDYEIFKDKHGFVMGGFEDMDYTSYEIQFHPGDRLFIYTDGIPEATNAKKELWGVDNLVVSLNSHKEDDAKALVEHVHEDVDQFVAEADQFDDITMLAFTYLGN